MRFDKVTDLHHPPADTFRRTAHRQFDTAHHGFRVHFLDEDERHDFPGHQTERGHQRGQCHADRDVFPAQRHSQKPFVPRLQHVLDKVFLELSQSDEGAFDRARFRRCFSTSFEFFGSRQVPQMRRQNDERFDERNAERGHHDDRQFAHEITDGPADEEHWSECRNRRCHRNQHRPHHFFRSRDRRFVRRLSFLDVPADVLTDHDRVVDDDAQYDDQSEHGQQIDRNAAHSHHDERAEERHRQTDRRPERHPPVQKQHQRNQHENQTGPSVAGHQIEPAFDKARQVRIQPHFERMLERSEPAFLVDLHRVRATGDEIRHL